MDSAIIDISHPEDPTLVTSSSTDALAYHLDVAGPNVYVACRSSGLRVFNQTLEAASVFAAYSGTLEFAAGKNERQIVLPLLHDQVWELLAHKG